MSVRERYQRWRRYMALRRAGVPGSVIRRAGRNFRCGPGAFFRPGEDIAIGNDVFIGRGVHIAAPCVIGDSVLIASNVAFVGGDHQFDAPALLVNAGGRGRPGKIIVGEDVWIGHGAIVLAGVCIGRGSIIGAGSVLVRDVPPCAIWGSPPAQAIRDRFRSPDGAALHMEFLERLFGPPRWSSSDYR